MLHGKSIICFGGEDWWYHHPHSKNHLMRRFARAGNKVIFGGGTHGDGGGAGNGADHAAVAGGGVPAVGRNQQRNGKPLFGSRRDDGARERAALGLDEQAVKDYIRENKPTYTQFEAWVKKNAKTLTPDAIEKHNASVRGYNHDDETRKGVLGACDIADDASAPKDAVNLNNLDDWYEFHRAVLA